MEAAALTESPENGLGNGPPETPPSELSTRLVSRNGALALGALLSLLMLLTLYGLIALWPAVAAATSDPPHTVVVQLLGVHWRPTEEVSLLMLVVLASALGGTLHASISFTDYVGNGRLTTSWIWWYVLRGLLGTSLAVLFYFALRGGLFSANTPTNVINPFGIAALAGLVGLFHKQATDKLRELFDTMFRTAPGKGDDQRRDSIDAGQPVVTHAERVRVPGRSNGDRGT